MKIKLQRKLKKAIIKSFGRGTYKGIIDGFLTLEKYRAKGGCITKCTSKTINGFNSYADGQCDYHNTFPKIK